MSRWRQVIKERYFLSMAAGVAVDLAPLHRPYGLDFILVRAKGVANLCGRLYVAPVEPARRSRRSAPSDTKSPKCFVVFQCLPPVHTVDENSLKYPPAARVFNESYPCTHYTLSVRRVASISHLGHDL